jgi:hypothetical protein
VYFELSIVIKRPPEDIFAFLRDKDKHQQKNGSPVLVLEKTTEGLPSVGTCYREVVQMMPLIKGEIISKITRFDPPNFLEEEFAGAGMNGHLAYQFLADINGTKLIQKQHVNFIGPLKLLHPIIRIILFRRLNARLREIKTELENK